eukprot:2146621-Pleurochrysis_carterae.AAC.2
MVFTNQNPLTKKEDRRFRPPVWILCCTLCRATHCLFVRACERGDIYARDLCVWVCAFREGVLWR